jgi:hypothetical protein
MRVAVQFILALITLVGVGLHLFFWFAAYQSVPNIKEWSRQAAMFNPWWMMDKNLLPAEHDHWRIKVLWSCLAYCVAGGLLLYL